MLKFWKKKDPPEKFLYSDLRPGDRIHKIVSEHIFPDLERIGFRLSKSSLEFTRKIEEFEQHIHFQKNMRNNGNQIVAFDIHFGVRSKAYVKWHQHKYEIAPLNDYILGTRAYYIPNWDHKYFETWWYDLAKNDNNDIIRVIKSNISTNGLPYLNSLSDKQCAITYILKQNSFYYTAPMLFDFALMLNDKKQAQEILTWFENERKISPHNWREDTLRDIKMREELFRNWV